MSHAYFSINIGGLQKSSLIDYPGKISAIIFTQGCNFRCPYCHNPELITGNREKETENGIPIPPRPLREGVNDLTLDSSPRPLRERAEFQNEERVLEIRVRGILGFLKKRISKLDGVVITGGEPTLHKDLPEFIRQIKDLGFCVKLDTNGTNQKMLQELIDEKLIDYVAMDIKAPIEKYSQITCTKVNTNNILKSIKILKSSNIDYEFRTTVVKSQLSVEDFEQIGKMISGAPKYYLQRFLPTKTLDRSFLNEETYSDQEFLQITNILQKYVSVEIR